MITLGTGLPGNGKTLFMLWSIAAKAKKENREVFYHNIKLADVEPVNSWQRFQPEKWMDLPHGSIVVIDECQEVFPKKPNGAQLPAHYEELAKHRHKGFDIFLITQHPTLIDNFVRRLVGQHYHSVRKFGLQRATVYEWSACNPAPENVNSQKSAITLKWAYPKEVYGWYKSAEVHTVKRSIPMKLVLAVLFVVAVLVVGWWALDRYQHRYDKQKPSPVAAAAAGPAGEPVAVVGGRSAAMSAADVERAAQLRELEDLREYVRQQKARVEGLAFTAPKYDEITKPVRAPIPAMCIQIGQATRTKDVSCKCWSQQATPMPDVPFNMCVEFARNGFFRDFDADRDRLASERTERGVDAIRAVPEAPVPSRQEVRGPSFVIPGKAMGPQRTDMSPGLNEQGEIEDGPPNNRATRAAAGAKVAGL